MPISSADSAQDNENAIAFALAQSGPVQLTPEELRVLAEKLYAMLRDDVRSMQARRQAPHVRR